MSLIANISPCLTIFVLMRFCIYYNKPSGLKLPVCNLVLVLDNKSLFICTVLSMKIPLSLTSCKVQLKSNIFVKKNLALAAGYQKHLYLINQSLFFCTCISPITHPKYVPIGLKEYCSPFYISTWSPINIISHQDLKI